VRNDSGRPQAFSEGSIGSKARELDNLNPRDRAQLNQRHWRKLLLAGVLYIGLLIGLRHILGPLPGEAAGRAGALVRIIVLTAFVFETMDSAAGMGFGTALSPLLLAWGYSPLAVVPSLLISEAITGAISGWFHHEFDNVHFSFLRRPMNDASKAVLVVAGTGVLAVICSVTLTYFALSLPEKIIGAYVALLLLGMGAVAVVRPYLSPKPTYRPELLVAFAALAGFNKGIGGGGYGPVVTLGELYAGVYEKSAAAITSLGEAAVSLAGVAAFFVLRKAGVVVDLSLLPSLFTGAFLAAVLAPYIVRVLPNRLFRHVIPVYALVLGIAALLRL